MSLFASVSLIFVLLTLEYAFAFIMFYSDEGKYFNLPMICQVFGPNYKKKCCNYSLMCCFRFKFKDQLLLYLQFFFPVYLKNVNVAFIINFIYHNYWTKMDTIVCKSV